MYISLMQSLSLNLASNSFELIVKMVLCEANLIIKERERERDRDKEIKIERAVLCVLCK